MGQVECSIENILEKRAIKDDKVEDEILLSMTATACTIWPKRLQSFLIMKMYIFLVTDFGKTE